MTAIVSTLDSGVVVTLVFNGHLHYPNDLVRSLNEDSSDKVRQYHTDYYNRPFL